MSILDQQKSAKTKGLGGDEKRSRRIVFAVIAAYVIGIVALAITGRFTFFPKEILIPLLLILPALTGRFREFLKDWVVFVALIVLFDSIRGLIFTLTALLDWPVYMQFAIWADRLLLGGEVLPVIMQRHLLDDIGFLEKFLAVVYASHFVAFFLFGMVIWYSRRERWELTSRGLLIVAYVGLIGYALFPTVPPWMASSYFETIPEIRKVTSEIYNVIVPTIASSLATNPIAAMPSLHTAIPMFLCFVGFKEFGFRALPFFAYTLAVFFGITYLGEHYLVDVLAGILLAALVYAWLYRGGIDAATERAPSVISRASFWQNMMLGAAIMMMTVFIAKAAARPDVRWSPTIEFIENDIVGHSPRGHEFLIRKTIELDRIPQAEALLIAIPMEEHTHRTAMLVSGMFPDKPEVVRDFANRYLAAAPNEEERVYMRVVLLARRGLIQTDEMLEAARWLSAQPSERAKFWAEDLMKQVSSIQGN